MTTAPPAPPYTYTYSTVGSIGAPRWVPAVMPFGKSEGKTTSKVLTDGRQFKCADCDYTAAQFTVVFAHRSTHGRRGHKPTTPKGARNRAADLIAQAATALTAATELLETPDNDSWKQRALTAEKRLAALRSALDL